MAETPEEVAIRERADATIRGCTHLTAATCVFCIERALRAQYVAGLLRAADMVDSRQGPGTGTAARIRELAEQAKRLTSP